jgi:hypothetical protein
MLELSPAFIQEREPAQKLLPDDFQLPDLSKLKPEEYSRTSDIIFPIEYREEKLFCKVQITRRGDLDNQQSSPPREYTCPLEIRVEGHDEDPTDANPFKSKFAFSTYLMVGEYPHKKEYENLNNGEPFWNTTYRMVEKEERGKGYGELALRLIKETVEKFNRETQLRGEYINIDSALSSLSRLIIDQQWLQDHGLGNLSKKSTQDLHFKPHPADEERAIELLQGSKVDLTDLNKFGGKDVKFIYRLEN